MCAVDGAARRQAVKNDEHNLQDDSHFKLGFWKYH